MKVAAVFRGRRPRLLFLCPLDEQARCERFLACLDRKRIEVIRHGDDGSAASTAHFTNLLIPAHAVVFIQFQEATSREAELAELATRQGVWCFAYARGKRFVAAMDEWLFEVIAMEGFHEAALDRLHVYAQRFQQSLGLPDLLSAPPAKIRLDRLCRAQIWKDNNHDPQLLLTGNIPYRDEADPLLTDYYACSRWHQDYQELERFLTAWRSSDRSKTSLIPGDQALEFESWLSDRPANAPDPGEDAAALIAASAKSERRRKWLEIYTNLSGWLKATDGDESLVDLDEFDAGDLRAWTSATIDPPAPVVDDALPSFADRILKAVLRHEDEKRRRRSIRC